MKESESPAIGSGALPVEVVRGITGGVAGSLGECYFAGTIGAATEAVPILVNKRQVILLIQIFPLAGSTKLKKRWI